jgi:patatin-like phospholipase/acyl hydrolase
VVDAALRSAAAPTYFPVYQGYCDGAVTANNPSLVAVSMALAHYPGLRREHVRVRKPTCVNSRA